MASDAGAISARRGFRIQDHVAARVVLEMLQDQAISQVECETGDDIVVRRQHSGRSVIEYIQVKTTESDTNWNLTELTARVDSRKRTSICEKSLLCDKHGEMAWFRLVTTRSVNSKLAPFRLPRASRQGNAPLAALINSFSTKYQDVRSACGRSLKDWAENLLWEVEADEDALMIRNTNVLLTIASGRGLAPAKELIDKVYDRLVGKTRTMADAPSHEPDEKVWSRLDGLSWWEDEIARLRREAVSTVKVYQMPRLTAFFSELTALNEGPLRRELHAYDVQYDGTVWRKDELIEHLREWLPEVALPPSVLAGFDYLSAYRLPGKALREIDNRGGVDMSKLVAALMLHAILRVHFQAEPIACRIFYSIAGTMRATSAHILQLEGRDEIWLGRSSLVTATSHLRVVDEVLAELRTALGRDVLKDERDIIIQLREPHHMRAHSLDALLTHTSKTADLLKVVRLPILVAYDSATLKAGFDDDYVEQLKAEVHGEYERIKARMGIELRDVEVSIFLVPVECAATLATDFETDIRSR
ncbi:dsDNA nuclease domain-containing protein [Sphingomonas sp. MMS12-HWE2-04]|uniref:HamA C-terminal domain-containing protein n=1 Tax=Sphingomonas sp. MMS12-HWE2-04 TaxID=3234199 RepID=UPI00384ABF52